MQLFRELFTLEVGDDIQRYAWSIAAARASGFSHKSGLVRKLEKDGLTHIEGTTPFSAIVYPSVRADRLALNYAINDQGMKFATLHNVQWVRRQNDGRIHCLDIASEWTADGTLNWTGRSAALVLKRNEIATFTKIGMNEWLFEKQDQSVPEFS